MATDRDETSSKASSRRVLGRTTAMLLTAAMIIGTGLFLRYDLTTNDWVIFARE